MVAGKDDLISAIRKSQQDIEETASSLPESAWSVEVHEQSWTAKQLLCHLVGSASFAGVMTALAKIQPRPERRASFDQDKFNAADIASRESKSVGELLEELRSNSGRSIAAVESAPDDLVSANYEASWGAEGPFADVIIEEIENHTRTHLAELRRAAG